MPKYTARNLPFLGFTECRNLSEDGDCLNLTSETNLLKTDDNNYEVYLYGNRIAVVTESASYYTMAGYGTPTTRRRLNQISNLTWSQMNHDQYVEGMEISASDWVKVSEDGIEIIGEPSR